MEIKIGRLEDLPDREPTSVKAGERTLLVVRSGRDVRVMPAECPHYHGPLPEGLVHEERLLCPWHQSAFAITDGALLDPPSFFALPTYTVSVRDQEVWVEMPDDARGQRLPAMSEPQSSERRVVAIVGAGGAAAAAADELRQAGFGGRIVMIGPENHPPYDRPNCSKDLLAGTMPASWMPLHSDKFYEKWGVERRIARVQAFDAQDHVLRLDDGQEVRADAVLLASGGTPRRLNLPGVELEGVHTLRTWDDTLAIVAACEAKPRVVIVGAGFIGMEAAASLRHRGLSVTIASPEDVPLQHVFGTEVGKALQELHESNGVDFRLGRAVEGLLGEGQVTAVQLEGGESLPAELVIVGIGITPATDFVQGVQKAPDHSLLVDARLRVAGTENVWAAGDIARFPAAHLDGTAVRIEHWRLALQHGRVAARNIAGTGEDFTGVPFFWTQQYDRRVNFVGYGLHPDETVVAGVPPHDFIAFYCSEGRPHAAAGTRDKQLCAFNELMRAGRLPQAERLREDPDLDLVELVG